MTRAMDGGRIGDEYDSGTEVVHTKEDDDFIDGDDDLADVLGEYDDEPQVRIVTMGIGGGFACE